MKLSMERKVIDLEVSSLAGRRHPRGFGRLQPVDQAILPHHILAKRPPIGNVIRRMPR
jgi:hypothetical protein